MSTRVLYLAPWVDYGGSDKGTIDWFRCLDRARYTPYLATTQANENRRLAEVLPFAQEVWPLPDLVDGQQMPELLFDLIATRGIGVLHIMNSRLAFDLLPDLATLPSPPKVVVQLHVEEQDRSGYVRLVTRRYGNLVDAFSVTSEQLARAVEGYDIPRSKLHVIHTGVDALSEFAPESAVAPAALNGPGTHVLFPGRLAEQKDPLLMVEVAARALAEEPSLRFHVVGDGPLEDQVRAAVAARGLTEQVRFHPPTRELAGWYAGADLLLMTSVFEGVPYTLYEAMAMALPAVAPALAGNVELLAGGGGVLVERRDDVAAYADALVALARDGARRSELGAIARGRALAEFSLDAMARAHEALYDALAPPVVEPARPAPAPAPSLRFARERGGTPLVSIIVPCFNHGRYLGECLEAIRAQTWPEIEVFVVDDASPEPETQAVLESLTGVELIRMPERGGPSKARNAALERAKGRYILPVDADNLLLPDAVERLVRQLQDAGELVGFVYPNLQYFGNRRDYFQVPDYNLFWLLEGNYCDTSALFDADVFEAGVRFDDSILLGHEDWELVLELASRGVRGEPARFPTLLYRKSGFNRSDAAEHASTHFSSRVLSAHPEFFGARDDLGRHGWHAGPGVTIKARWRPGLSVIALAPGDTASLRDAAASQTCADFELLARVEAELPPLEAGPSLRRLPAALATSPAAALSDALAAARSDLVLVCDGDVLGADPALLEKLLRAREARPDARTIVLCDAGPEGRYPLRLLGGREAPAAVPHAVLFHRDEVPAELSVGAPVDSIVQALSLLGPLQWRHLARPAATSAAGATKVRVTLASSRDRVVRKVESDRSFALKPALPALATDREPPRWGHIWTPPITEPLVRHRALGGDTRIATLLHAPPAGYAAERLLGFVHRFQAPGMAELRGGDADGPYVLAEDDEGAPRLREPLAADWLGFLEEAPLPGLEQLFAARVAGQWVLAGQGDPLLEQASERRFLGFLEPVPRHPRLTPVEPRPYGLVPLVRSVDRAARRHRYGAGEVPAGELSLELGALHTERQEGSVALRLSGDRPELPAGVNGAADARLRARWAVAPLTWRGAGPAGPRARAAARRALDALRPSSRSVPAATAEPAGYLWSEDGPGRRPVYVAVHPVTGDRLLTPWPLEASDMGYGSPVLLGWASTVTSLTGSFEPHPVDVPWASRFGREARRG